ncbi:hypothetical protein PQX77_006267 [Marasmius sp. AFHP31]|nr:hypothetical protein PQX77_006267 [Marasmius sp. AFHP31]
MTKDLGGISGVQPPDGVEPPVVVQEEDMTIDLRYHGKYKLLTSPEASITHHSVSSIHPNTVLTLKLSAKPGALLMLPKGAVLKKLERTSEFKRRILRH